MKVEILKIRGWDDALDCARTTAGLNHVHTEPSEEWKRMMLVCEHSPIRLVEFIIHIENVPMWVTTHLVRHHIGIEKFVRTQRTDRTGSDIPRGEHLQGEPNVMTICVNAQALINISKERLCTTASMETRTLWRMIISEIEKEAPEFKGILVQKCIYRGICSERASCKYYKTDSFKKRREDYKELCEKSLKNYKKWKR